ncbi:RpiR family transcriptional regulator [Brachybacterium ginsengisoli]|uniref:RpiR family transcriptional regulator n=1 Tax=Brachybacterium ginsengisoli TaxID=1331682 RepID=A0A291GW71_9MICO|nr:MurR/RpiR family transcriptional regulator [Brachybacterium ginsengisoli]ATG54471.1 RpiR family transcriptional regulator [Brachybacterium ginsengisoli]
MSTQSLLQGMTEDLPPSMRRVAEAVLADPQRILRTTITELAAECRTSEPTVVRLCQRLGMTGYAELRLTLAGELASEQVRRPSVGGAHGADLPVRGTLSEIVADVALAEVLGIEETAASLDMDALERATAAIAAAPVVLLHGIGASASVAGDFERKLQRIGRRAHSPRDTHDALAAAALMGPGEVAIGFSHSGTTTETAAFLTTARSAGATTIALTNGSGGPVVANADIPLRTTVRESVYRSGAMASRSAQLLVVDCLFVAVAGQARETSVDALRRTYDALEEYRGA